MHCKRCFSVHVRRSTRWGYLPLWFLFPLARCGDCKALFRVPFWVYLEPPRTTSTKTSAEISIPEHLLKELPNLKS